MTMTTAVPRLRWAILLLVLEQQVALQLQPHPSPSRRSFFGGAAAGIASSFPGLLLLPSSAASVVPDSALRLGVVNGLLADCDSKQCVSSQDDATDGGRCFAEPWTYEGTMQEAFSELRSAVLEFRAGGLSKDIDVELSSAIVDPEGRFCYLRVAYVNRKSGAIDDAEFYLPSNDVTVQYRVARRNGVPDITREMERRLESIRKTLHFDKIPVLRNRRRALPFGESPFDSFGPSVRDFDFADTEAVDAEDLSASPRDPRKMKGLRLEADPLAAPFQPSTAAMRQLKNERPQLDDYILPFGK